MAVAIAILVNIVVSPFSAEPSWLTRQRVRGSREKVTGAALMSPDAFRCAPLERPVAAPGLRANALLARQTGPDREHAGS
jgi:hypothetical protein